MEENIVIKDKCLVQRKFNLLVDFSLMNGELQMGQRLNSFFGQVGIFENTEKIVDFIKEYIEYYILEDPELNFNELIDDDDYIMDDFVVYLPLTMVFYYGDKKVDFFVRSSWFKNSFTKNLKLLYINNFVLLLKYKKSLFDSFNYYQKIFEYNKILKILYKDNFYSKFNNLLYKTFLPFYIEEDLRTVFYEEYTGYLFKRKKRISFFKKLKTKNKLILLSLNKKIENFSNVYNMYIILTKLSFFDEDFNDKDLVEILIRNFSQIYTFKFLFLKRFRRRKRFKRALVKDFMGKKFTFYKILNFIEEKKKKRRK